jgi:hypothetical protein
VRLRLLSVLALLALVSTGCFGRPPTAAPGSRITGATASPSPSPAESPTDGDQTDRTDGDDSRANGRSVDPSGSAAGKDDAEAPPSTGSLDSLVEEEVGDCTMTSAARNPEASTKLGATDYLVIKYDCDGLELVHELMPYESVGRAVGAFKVIVDAFVSKGAEVVGEQELTNRDGEVYGRIVGLQNLSTGRYTLLWGNGNLLAGISGPQGPPLDEFFRNVPY